MKLTPLVLAACLAALAAPAGAQIANGGFETGDLTGWTPENGSIQAVASAQDYYQVANYPPTHGAYFARLIAGEEGYATLSQLFTLKEASILSFNAAFLAFDDTDHNDDAYVRVFDALTNAVLFQSSVLAVDSFGHGDWATFSRHLDAGSYTLEAGVRNVDGSEPEYSSELLLDNVTITAAAVPEPDVWAMMIVGFCGVGVTLRRRRRLAVAT